MQRDGKTQYKKVRLREKWTKRLDNNTVIPHYSQEEIMNVINWCRDFKMGKGELEQALHNNLWRTNMKQDVNY